MRRFSTGLLLVLVLSLDQGQVTAQSTNPDAQILQDRVSAIRERLQNRLEEFHAGGGFPGATAGIRMPDGTSFGIAVGVSNRETGLKMQPDDRMLVGSTGKTFFAAVALQLVSEGRLDLDRPVKDYLGTEQWYGELPNGDSITVRQLMNHTSGIVRYEFNRQFLVDLTADPDRVWKPHELVAYILGTEPPFPAGEGWTYSDTNYILLGIIVEKITGETFYSEIKRRLLDPLELRNTVPSDSRTIPGLVQGYAGEGNPFGGTDAMIQDGRFAINPQFEWAGGGFASTTQDLARWAADIYEGRAYAPELLEEALDGVPARGLGRDTRYGLGVIIWQMPAGLAYGHSGFFPGYLTEVRYFPEHRFAIAFQVNASAGIPREQSPVLILNELAQIIIEELNRELTNGQLDEAPAQEIVQLTTDPAMDYHPRWSPDGSKIAFTSGRSGERAVYTMNTDGSGVTPVITGIEGDLHIAWSPDGSRLVYDASPEGGLPNLWLIEVDGGTKTQLTDVRGLETHPHWSPDGARIAYSDGDDIFTISPGGGPARRITTNRMGAMHPCWSPDGAMIAYTAESSSNHDIWTVPVSGGDPRRITDHRGRDDWANWSPDGTKIVFDSDRTGSRQLCIYDLETDSLSQLTRGDAGNWQADWAPDGRRIAFVSDRSGNLDIWIITFNP